MSCTPIPLPPLMRLRAIPWPEIARFGVTGVVNTGFGYLVFAVLLTAGLTPLPALVLSTAAGVAFNLQTARRIVFRTDGRGRLVRFVVLYMALLALNWAALRTARDLGFAELAAQAVLAVPLAAIAYAGQRWLVFGPAAARRSPQ